MKIYQIKSKKQDNGLWGSPMNLYKIEFINGYPKDDYLNLLISAIIIKFDEIYNISFSCKIYDNIMTISVKSKNYKISYKYYGVVDYKFYYFENDDDIKLFSRNQKLNKLKNKFISL